MSEIKTMLFAGTAASRTTTILVSRPIMRPFSLRRITVRFPSGCQSLLSVEFWVSADDDTASAGNPAGTNLLGDYGQADALRGEGEQVSIQQSVEVLAAPVYVKVRAINSDYYDHAINVDIEIELLT